VASILAAIAHHAPGSPDAAGRAQERDPGVAESDQVVLPSLIRLGLGLLDRHVGTALPRQR
jgi:hypothetical protein